MQRTLISNLIIGLVFFSSCISNQKQLFADSSSALPSGADIAFVPAVSAPNESARPWEAPKVRPDVEIPAAPDQILGRGKVSSESLARFLIKTNPYIEEDFAKRLAKIYVEEAAIEGVNHDVAFSQMCLETGFLSFGGLVKPEMNNYCGLGSTGPDAIGASFPSPRIGIRAQIQHLKIYATAAPLKQRTVDPRRGLVRPGSATTIDQLAGSWAEDREYGKKIKTILERLYMASYGS